MKVAVLDLGTNVFNLLLAEFSASECRYIKEYKCAAKLGAGGLAKGFISSVAFETAREALDKIVNVIKDQGGADIILPFATSAVRDANNGPEFVKYINSIFGLSINVIPGEREAEFIFKGIMESMVGKLAIAENILMLDIGGGSNEFIISDGKSILWKKSFPIGMARMRERFNYEEPIKENVVNEFYVYCNQILGELWIEIDKYKPTVFIGSSGSFDTFKDLIYNCEYKELPSIELPLEKLIKMGEILVKSVAKERILMPGMSNIRVDYIVLAWVFTKMIFDRIKPRIVYQSSYSLKEGAMQEEYLKFLQK
ncbi:MAG: hypothetical protein RSC28_03385 [Bacteroidales bacterium]